MAKVTYGHTCSRCGEYVEMETTKILDSSEAVARELKELLIKNHTCNNDVPKELIANLIEGDDYWLRMWLLELTAIPFYLEKTFDSYCTDSCDHSRGREYGACDGVELECFKGWANPEILREELVMAHNDGDWNHGKLIPYCQNS